MNAAPIEFFFDFISPYGYLASTQIDAIGARHGRRVEWKPFLVGVTVLKVMGLKPLMETPLKSTYIAQDKPRMARLLGVPITQRDMAGVNSLAASRAYLWLAQQDAELARRFAHGIYERLWVRGQDITAAGDVAAEAEKLGVDAGELRAAIAAPRWKDALRRAVEEAISRNVFGAPFFIADGEPIWGVDRLWMLEHWLKYGSWDPAPPPARP